MFKLIFLDNLSDVSISVLKYNSPIIGIPTQVQFNFI